MELQDKVVWVTGAARRLGRAIAADLARRGADLALHYFTSKPEIETLRQEIEALGRRAVIVSADLRQIGQIRTAVDEIGRAFGRLDVLVNSASNFNPDHWNEITEERWDASLDVNLKGPAFCALEAARLMLHGDGGKIINFADSAALRPYRGYLPYMVSKGGMLTLTKTLALELAPKITVNAIAPGPVLPPDDTTEDERRRMIRYVPLQRLGSPQDIVEAVRFFIEGSDYITGQILCVDGGRQISSIY